MCPGPDMGRENEEVQAPRWLKRAQSRFLGLTRPGLVTEQLDESESMLLLTLRGCGSLVAQEQTPQVT